MSGAVRGTDWNESQATETGPFLNILSLRVVCSVCILWRRRAFRNHFSLSSLPLGRHSTSDRSYTHTASFFIIIFYFWKILIGSLSSRDISNDVETYQKTFNEEDSVESSWFCWRTRPDVFISGNVDRLSLLIFLLRKRTKIDFVVVYV